MTLHPQRKSGVNISKKKYDTVRVAIHDSLRIQPDMTFKELTEEVHQKLDGSFDGSIRWYVTTVKLDLEAQGIIERIPKRTPQRVRLVAQ